MYYVTAKSLKQKWIIEETLEKYNKKLIARNPDYLLETLEKEKVLSDFVFKYYKKRVEKNLHIKTIVPYNDVSIKYQKEWKDLLRKIAIISDEFNFTTELYIYDNIVSIASFKELFAVVIESYEIAQTFKNFYKLAWKTANWTQYWKVW